MDGLYEQARIALHQIWQRRWIALAVAWGVALLGWLALSLFPNSYESRARLQLQTPSILPTQMGIVPDSRQNDLFRLKQSLTATANLEQVVRRTDLNRQVTGERDLARQVDALRGNIQVVAQQDNLFELIVTANFDGLTNAENARTSAAIGRNLIDLIVAQHQAEERAETGQSLEFLDEELRRREAELQEAEQRRVEFEERFLGLLPGEGSIAQRMSQARTELVQVEQQILAARGAVNAMRGQLAATPQSLPGAGGGYGPASTQLAALEGQLSQSLARGWTDQHPDVIATRAQIERLRPQARAEQAGGGGGVSNPSYVSLRAMMTEREAQLAGVEARRAQLVADLQRLGARQAEEPGQAAEQARLTRDHEVLKRQYDRLLENREQIRLRGDVQTVTDPMSFRIIDPPSQPSVPSAPNRPLFMTLILIVAAGAGIGVAFVIAQLRTTFPTQASLQRITALPVLGAVSEVVDDAARRVRRQRLAWLGGGAGALAGLWCVLMAVEFWQRAQVA